MYKLFRAVILLCSLQVNAQQVYTDPAAAFDISKNTDKPVLLIFSGSDWCIPCIQFNVQILKDSLFLDYTKNKLIILEADFPQRKKIAPAMKTQYKALAEKYNPSGVFPRIVLLDKEGRLIGELSYNQQSSATFIAEIKQQLGW